MTALLVHAPSRACACARPRLAPRRCRMWSRGGIGAPRLIEASGRVEGRRRNRSRRRRAVRAASSGALRRPGPSPNPPRCFTGQDRERDSDDVRAGDAPLRALSRNRAPRHRAVAWMRKFLGRMGTMVHALRLRQLHQQNSTASPRSARHGFHGRVVPTCSRDPGVVSVLAVLPMYPT